MEYYLAVDIGASSGRHMLGWKEDGRIRLKEIYRFENGMQKRNGHLCWDVDALYSEIINGLKACKAAGMQPATMGIDTWGVDFVLVNRDGERLGPTIGYRDSRTEGMDTKVSKIIAPEELYRRTGTQKQLFNTIYQLMAIKEQTPELLEEAQSLMMMPDYLNYMLTGVKRWEYTIATTTQLLDITTGNWDEALIRRLGYPEGIFGPLVQPGNLVGTFTDVVRAQAGFDCSVVLVASHDTASAVMAVPSTQEEVLYISSGTWSLIGIERECPDCSMESMRANLTNEGGYGGTIRYLKNVMGLWMIQSVRREWKERLSYGEICSLASEEEISSIVDCDAHCFLAPESMILEIQRYCRDSGQQVPETIGELAAVIYNSLAVCYKQVVQEIEERTGTVYEKIHIIGGGANAGYLNELTAKATGKTVYAGPTEATAIGNLIAQMLRTGAYENLKEARAAVRESFPIEKFKS